MNSAYLGMKKARNASLEIKLDIRSTGIYQSGGMRSF